MSHHHTYNISLTCFICFGSLHLTKSSAVAVKLFSDALAFIGRASYQEEHPNKSGELVLVLIKQMEMILSVAGWCLASGVISEEKYASIVEKLFSDQHNDVVDLIFCISDVAVTCAVQEDLTRTDYLVFLRCHNLYEVIDIEMSYASARAEAEVRYLLALASVVTYSSFDCVCHTFPHWFFFFIQTYS